MGERWYVFIALICLIPSLGMAQEQPSNPVRTDGGNASVAANELPPAYQLARIPEPFTEPAQSIGLTLAQLEQMAARCNPTLAQAAARAQAARGRYVQAGLYPNPVIGYQASEIGDEGRAGQQGGFVGQEIVTAGKLRLSQSVANEEIRQAEFAWQSQQMRVCTDVRRAFYEVLVAQRSLELTEKLVGIGEQGIKTAEQLMKAKEVARVDVLQARIEADSAKILLEKARNRHAGAWRNLTAVVGDPALQPTPLGGNLQDDLPEFTWDDTLNRLLSCSPQLAAAQAGVARAQAALNREFAGRIPNLDLQASVQYDNATRDSIAGVQVGVPFPIFNRNQGNIVKAQAELTAAQHEVQRVKLALQQRLAAVFEQYATARQQVEKYAKDIVPNAQDSLNLVAAGYRQGEFSYLMLLTAQRTFFQTNLAHLESLRDFRTAAATIEGNLLFDSLQSPESTERASPER
jgi:outer membrane protein, heavy metal efflux system